MSHIGHNSGHAFVDLDPAKIAQELSERGLAWADAHAAAEALEETKNTVLAEVVADRIASGESPTAAERVAKADPRFREHIERMVAARRAANRARVRWDTYKAFVELQRTRAATERAAMNMR